MPTTFTLDRSTTPLSTGQSVQIGFGGGTGNPVAIPDAATAVTISVDRTAGVDNLNGLPNDAAQDELHMRADVSTDGGATWSIGYVDFKTSGGVFVNPKTGQQVNSSFVGPLQLPAGPGRVARGLVESIVGTITFIGTLTLTP